MNYVPKPCVPKNGVEMVLKVVYKLRYIDKTSIFTDLGLFLALMTIFGCILAENEWKVSDFH